MIFFSLSCLLATLQFQFIKMRFCTYIRKPPWCSVSLWRTDTWLEHWHFSVLFLKMVLLRMKKNLDATNAEVWKTTCILRKPSASLAATWSHSSSGICCSEELLCSWRSLVALGVGVKETEKLLGQKVGYGGWRQREALGQT